MNKTEKYHPENNNLLQTNNENISQLENLQIMVTQAITGDRKMDHNILEISSSKRLTTETINAQKLNTTTGAGFQPQTQTTSLNEKSE